ncbi:MAG: nickel-dependent lactate racemase, partial [Deltaproteobacteria bacterium]|nr:nickel-dependent lactate racemase [Deltaproteobacteria bacterium]
MLISLAYGESIREFEIPDKADVTLLSPSRHPILEDVTDALEEALDHLVGTSPFEDLVRERVAEKVVMVVPDETRPALLKIILPPLLKRLHDVAPQLKSSGVTILVRGGLHPPMDSDRLENLIPSPIAPGCRVIAHDAKNARMVDFGSTGRGTPVRVNAEFIASELRMVIGQIDPHQFVCFTGGSKGAVIGVASSETIEHNHGLLFQPNAQVGRLKNNPVRQDINEAGGMVGIHFVVDVVLDSEKRVVQVMAGEPDSVLATAAQTCASLYEVPISEKFEIVIASCAGHPKDICLYQAQKGLNLASHALKPGGKILLLAACPQGVGDGTYLEYVSRFDTPQQVIEDFTRLGFKMGAHKAFLFARTLDRFEVAMASDLDSQTLKKCHL